MCNVNDVIVCSVTPFSISLCVYIHVLVCHFDLLVE